MKVLYSERVMAVLLCLLLASGCARAAKSGASPAARDEAALARSQPSPPPPDAPPQGGPAPGAPQPPPADRLIPPSRPIGAAGEARGPAGASLPPPPPVTYRTPPPPTLAAALRAFGLGVSKPLMPEDFRLGPLQDERTADTALAGALATAKAFMAGIAAGRLDPKILAPDTRDILALVLAPGGAPSSSETVEKTYRLGTIRLDGDSAALRVLLPHDEAKQVREGLLSLRSIDGAWYVESLSVEGRPEGEKPTFDPGAIPPQY